MLVLFVCVANVARSQMAEAFFNRLSREHSARSAGARVGKWEGQTVAGWAGDPDASSSPGQMLEIMRSEEDIDLSANLRKQLTPEMVAEADRVIVLNSSDPCPDYLRSSAKAVFWEIPDVVGGPRESVHRLKNLVKAHVESLVREIG